MVLLFFWIGFAVIVGVAANSRGRNGIYWGLLAMLISPLLAGPLLFALPRLDPLNDIAALALFEATPEGSRSRQLFAERQAKQATQSAQSLAKREALLDRFGVGALRSDYKKSEWHDEAVRKGRTSFKVGMCIWAGFLLIGLVAVLSGPLKSQSTTPVAAQAALPQLSRWQARRFQRNTAIMYSLRGTPVGNARKQSRMLPNTT
jgi:hypothetical protein